MNKLAGVIVAILIVTLAGGAGAEIIWVRAPDTATGVHPLQIIAADINGDDWLDLLTVNPGTNTISVLVGNNDASFIRMDDVATDTEPVSLAVGLLNNDWMPDVVTSNNVPGTMSVRLGDGGGGFSTNTYDYASAGNPGSIKLGDFNEDGHLDAAMVSRSYNVVTIFPGRGDGTFGDRRDRIDVGTWWWPTSLAVADFDGDGHLDLATAGPGTNWFSVIFGAGDGTFGIRNDFNAGGLVAYLAVADANDDGKPDLLAAVRSDDPEAPGAVTFIPNLGGGAFGTLVYHVVGFDPQSIAVGDLDLDEKLDLAVANYGSNTLSVLLGNGDGTFIDQATLECTAGPTSVAMGDLTGDGLLDLAATNYEGETVTVYVNDPPLQAGVGEPARAAARLAVAVAPNPMRGSARLFFSLPAEGRARLEVFDASGRRVAVPVDAVQDAGSHSVAWDGLDSGGRAVTPGMYFLKLTAGGQVTTGKMVVGK